MNSILLTQNVWLLIQRLKDDPVHHEFLTPLTSDKPNLCFDSMASKAAGFRGAVLIWHMYRPTDSALRFRLCLTMESFVLHPPTAWSANLSTIHQTMSTVHSQ